MAARLVMGGSAAGDGPCRLPLDRPGRYVLGMTDGITPRQFYEAEGVDDWLVLAEGAEACFRTGSFAASVRLVPRSASWATSTTTRPTWMCDATA